MPSVINLQDALDEVENFKDDAISSIQEIIKSLNKAINLDDAHDIISEIEDAVYELELIVNNLG